MAVVAPMVAAPLLGLMSHLPKGDWRIGAPLYFCAALQVGALCMAVLYFRKHHQLVSSLAQSPGLTCPLRATSGRERFNRN